MADPYPRRPEAALPGGVSPGDLAAYCLMLGDDALVLSHRLQQWVTRAPALEDELALATVALDLLGQARLLLSRAGHAEGAGRDEDTLAYRRGPGEFRNVCLAERTDPDFAHLVARLFVLATWRSAVLSRLTGSRDPVLAEVAAKGTTETARHRDYAARWIVRLGSRPGDPHTRMAAAVAEILTLTDELFRPDPVESSLAAAGVAVDPASVRPAFDAVVARVLSAAGIPAPAPALVRVAGSASVAAPGSVPASGPGPASFPAGGPAAVPASGPAAGLGFRPATSLPGSSPTSAAMSEAEDRLGDGPDQSRGRAGRDASGFACGSAFYIRPAPRRTGRPAPIFRRGRDGVHTQALTEILDEMQAPPDLPPKDAS